MQCYVWSPTREHRERFASEFCQSLPTPLAVCDSPREVVSRAHIVCTVTKAKTPVLSGAWVKPGTHINAVRSNAASRQELGGDTVCLADVIVVDSLKQTVVECGDLPPLIETGKVSWDDVIEPADVVSSDEPVRTDPSRITIFESHGLGVWDVAMGKLVLERASAASVCTALPF
jgi:ornithine cyclodeaminase/alanine dehydrogenase-like protein (mu-crystallin family)